MAAADLPARRPTVSLMRVGRIALETVHHARLGGTEGDPVLRGVLQRDEERFASLQGSFVQLLSPFELELKRELPDERGCGRRGCATAPRWPRRLCADRSPASRCPEAPPRQSSR